MMDSVLKETIATRLDELLLQMAGTFPDLPVEALDWTPDPAVNSISVLIIHSTGALRFWVGELIGGQPSHRDRQAEFEVKDLSKFDLRDRLEQTRTLVQAVLTEVTPDQLMQKYYSTIHKQYYTGIYALVHALTHTALHLGHLEMLREAWERFNWDRKGARFDA